MFDLSMLHISSCDKSLGSCGIPNDLHEPHRLLELTQYSPLFDILEHPAFYDKASNMTL